MAESLVFERERFIILPSIENDGTLTWALFRITLGTTADGKKVNCLQPCASNRRREALTEAIAHAGAIEVTRALIEPEEPLPLRDKPGTVGAAPLLN